MKIVGMNNGPHITIIMRPSLFVDVLDKLIECYDNYIVSGVTEFLSISKFTTRENYAAFRQMLLNTKKPVFFAADLTIYTSDQHNESAAAYTHIISSIVDSIVYNEGSNYSSSDFEIITPGYRSGSPFYIDDMFINIGRINSVTVTLTPDGHANNE